MSKSRKEAGALENEPGFTPAVLPGQEMTSAPASNGDKVQETKSQRFRRLANRRLAQAVKMIERLIPLANRAQYESGPEEFDVLCKVLNEAFLRVQSAYSNTAPRKEAPTLYFR